MQEQQTTDTRYCQNPECGRALPDDLRADATTCNPICSRLARRYRQRDRFWLRLRAIRGRPFHLPRESGSVPRRALSRTPYAGSLA